MNSWTTRTLIGLILTLGQAALLSAQAPPAKQGAEQASLPAKFDLRTVNGVTPIKQQQGGTCWTHGTMAAIESHMLLAGTWKAAGLPGVPALSEYHLDWW